MKPHDRKPFVVHRKGEGLTPPATWEACTLEDLLAEPAAEDATGPWLASVYQRLVVAGTGPVALGRTSQRLDGASWFHAAVGADLDAARAACWPALGAAQALAMGVGSLAPRLVLVGESAAKGQLPFLSRGGLWLWKALRAHGWDELACYVTNAFAYEKARRPLGSELRRLHDAFEKYQPLWIALGQKASMVLGGAGIVHVQVDHPQNWSRYKHEAGPSGYAGHLLAQGVPRGPWYGQKLPVVLLEDGAAPEALLASRLGLPLSVAHAPQPRVRVSTSAKVADARRFYVTGADGKGGRIETLKQACDAAGASYHFVMRVARRENWDAERAAQQAKTLEKAKEKASDVEAQKIATCRSLAWTATALGLGSVVRRLQSEDGDLKKEIDPRQVLALGKLALGISQLGDPQTTDEFKRVQELGATELLKEYRKALGALGVEEGEEA